MGILVRRPFLPIRRPIRWTHFAGNRPGNYWDFTEGDLTTQLDQATWNFHGGNDLNVSNAEIRDTPHGRTMFFNGTNAGATSENNERSFSSLHTHTLIYMGVMPSGGEQAHLFGWADQSANVRWGRYRLRGDPDHYFYVDGDTTGGYDSVQGGKHLLRSGDFFCCVIVNNNNSISAWVNGRQVMNAQSFTWNYANSIDTFGIGHVDRSSDLFMVSQPMMVSFSSNFALSDSLAQEISRNPWQATDNLYAPQRVWVPIPAAGGGTTYEVDITVSPTMGVTDSVNVDYDVGVDVSPDMGVDDGALTTYNTDSSISPTLGLTGSAATIYNVASALAATYGLSTSAEIAIEGSIGVSISSGLSSSAETTYNTDISTSADIGISPTALVDYNTALTLALQAAISTAGAFASNTFEESISVSWSQGVTPTVDIVFDGTITLATSEGISTAANTTYNGSVALTTSMGINAVTQWLMEAGITLATIEGISASFDSVSFDIVTPDGRTLKVKFENRAHIIDEEGRTIYIYS